MYSTFTPSIKSNAIQMRLGPFELPLVDNYENKKMAAFQFFIKVDACEEDKAVAESSTDGVTFARFLCDRGEMARGTCNDILFERSFHVSRGGSRRKVAHFPMELLGKRKTELILRGYWRRTRWHDYCASYRAVPTVAEIFNKSQLASTNICRLDCVTHIGDTVVQVKQ